MFRKIEDFQKSWTEETDSTLKLLDKLTDDSLAQRVTPDGRSLGFIAWHLVLTLGEMMGHAGLKVDAPAEDAPAPAKAGAIREAFDKAAQSLGAEVARNWTDDSLGDDVQMYGETWKRGQVLSSIILHQAHHRGQMTVLMRQAGVGVTGVYGPSREEWAQYGMKPQR
ncbi:MAG: DinB family protein [Acidobacteria bacterium]|nr:DinB family protein [Acidobacteriota bacterium]